MDGGRVMDLLPSWLAGRRIWVLAGVIGAVAVAGIVVAIVGTGGGKVTVSGGLFLQQGGSSYTDQNFRQSGGQCYGSGGYSDITGGADVTVEDAAGKVIATGALDTGRPRLGQCLFRFSVSGVPTSKFYKVEVTHRGSITVPAKDAGDVGMSLGQ